MDLKLLFDHKQPKSFNSAAWGTTTNPDLSFYSCNANSSIPHPIHKIIGHFPKSQHRLTIIYHPALIEHTATTPLPRWNFNKADWARFKIESGSMCDDLPSLNTTDINSCYSAFQNKLIKVAKNTITRGFRKSYIPKWDATCDQLAKDHEQSNSKEERQETANKLLDHLSVRRKEVWLSTVESIDMKHSSRKAWAIINKLTGRKNVSPNPHSVSANSVASCLLKNGKFDKPNRDFTRKVNRQLKIAWNAPSTDQNLCSDFSINEIATAIKTLKAGKAPGPDNLHPEFFLHLHENCIHWLQSFFNHCIHSKKLPKMWKLSKVVAVLKPNKPQESAKSYRPISLLCIAYKLYERLILNHIQPIVESVLPKEQAGFRQGYCTLDQVALLTEDIEISFDKRLKSGIVLVDLSAAYDIVWHRGLTLKLLRTIPSKEMVQVIMSMISQRRFHVHMREEKSRCRTLTNGVPQGSVIAPALFNLYTYDIPHMISNKYVYADDIALLHSDKQFQVIERTLSRDLDELRIYFHNWRLNLNTSKTVASTFHLNNNEANYKLKVITSGKRIHFDKTPKYLDVTFDRTLSYKKHLQNIVEKKNYNYVSADFGSNGKSRPKVHNNVQKQHSDSLEIISRM